MKERNERGFTLIELLAVVAIIAILAGIGIPLLVHHITDARHTALVAEANLAARTIRQEMLKQNEIGGEHFSFTTNPGQRSCWSWIPRCGRDQLAELELKSCGRVQCGSWISKTLLKSDEYDFSTSPQTVDKKFPNRGVAANEDEQHIFVAVMNKHGDIAWAGNVMGSGHRWAK